MKKLIEKIGLETFWGGIFALVTAIAIVIEVVLAGLEPAAIAGGVKDLFGTLITIVMLLVAVKALKPQKQVYSFEEKVNNALVDWISSHSNMIVKTSKMPKGHENDFGMSMTTDINRFYNTAPLKSDTGSGVGRFLRITKIDKAIYESNEVKFEFFINAQTYCISSSEEEILKELMDIANNLSKYIQGVVDGITVGAVHKEGDRTVIIPITFKEPIITDESENIDLIINLIDRMYEAMLVSARRK
ncbi:MAG: hypothetical protein IKV41_03095 [Oscillospiraceae bacterium]|nr:hypothetical protein [Oscillospiraceae bacterium]